MAISLPILWTQVSFGPRGPAKHSSIMKKVKSTSEVLQGVCFLSSPQAYTQALCIHFYLILSAALYPRGPYFTGVGYSLDVGTPLPEWFQCVVRLRTTGRSPNTLARHYPVVDFTFDVLKDTCWTPAQSYLIRISRAGSLGIHALTTLHRRFCHITRMEKPLEQTLCHLPVLIY